MKEQDEPQSLVRLGSAVKTRLAQPPRTTPKIIRRGINRVDGNSSFAGFARPCGCRFDLHHGTPPLDRKILPCTSESDLSWWPRSVHSGIQIYDEVDLSNDGTAITVHGTVDDRTRRFRDSPLNMPESAILGVAYVGNFTVARSANYRVVDAAHRFMKGVISQTIGSQGWNTSPGRNVNESNGDLSPLITRRLAQLLPAH